MQKISLLGSTGSIGLNVLDVVRRHKTEFSITALAAGKYSPLLESQIKEFSPRYVSVADVSTLPSAVARKKGFLSKVKFLSGVEGLKSLASFDGANLVFISVVGAVGLYPLIEAINKGKKIALANKESIVVGGEFLRKKIFHSSSKKNDSTGLAFIKKNNLRILPVDSEHSSLFQILDGVVSVNHTANCSDVVWRLIITASGGALYKHRKILRSRRQEVTIKDVLKHPTWKMGKKITVDSATLMNKGLEVIEAHHLFGMPYEKISVVIHPQSIVHSMVEFADGSIVAHLSPTDMRYAIRYALGYPRRLKTDEPQTLSVIKRLGALEFEEPEFSKFPCFSLALAAGKSGGIIPSVMNAANEVAVDAFLAGKIQFRRIPYVIEKTMFSFRNISEPSLSDIIDADIAAREIARGLI